MKRCDWLNPYTLVILYDAAIRKMQWLQDLVTDARGGIGDSRSKGKNLNDIFSCSHWKHKSDERFDF